MTIIGDLETVCTDAVEASLCGLLHGLLRAGAQRQAGPLQDYKTHDENEANLGRAPSPGDDLDGM